jgi:tRNA-dihydrouridine synthase B
MPHMANRSQEGDVRAAAGSACAFSIGAVPIGGELVLAPMSGYNDQPFRRLCRRFGAALVYTGLVSAKSIVYGPPPLGNPRTAEMLHFHPDELPVVCQLFGDDASVIVEAARRIEPLGMVAIDVNLGCAKPKVAGSGAGASLLRDPVGVAQLFSALTQALSLPVSGKIRLGWDEESRNHLEVARALADHGAAVIAVHGRTAVQGYRGTADWEAIAEVKQAVTVPVLASGDVKQPEDVERILASTGCDGVMIGRGAIGHPWIFQGRHRDEIPWRERAALVREHLQMMVAFHGEVHGVHRFRKHLRGYLSNSGVPRQGRHRMMHCDDLRTLMALLDQIEVGDSVETGLPAPM